MKGSDATKALKKLILILTAVLVLLLADSSLRLTVTEYKVSASNLPAAFDGYRIVQLSDLHGKEFGTDNEKLVKQVAGLAPDLIALTGDFIESEADLPVTQTLVEQLSEIAPVYFTSGNHDWASHAINELKATVNNSGGIYLSNTYLELEHNGDSIILVGVEDPNSWADFPTPDRILEAAAAEYPHRYTILLAHRNDFPEKYPALPCDVIFVGHGHGGVIRLPIVGGLLGTELQLFPQYDAGLFLGERYTMVVSRGLGDAPLFPRFLNNPEIVSVTLHRSSVE